jgi:hypothetical protein
MNSLKVFFLALKNQLVDIWNRSKIFLLAIVSLVVYFEWQKIKEYLLLYIGQKEIQSDKKEDRVLETKENSENDQANALVQQANNLPKQEGPVSDNWYEKDKK